jgi:hypothetical protein
MAKQVTKIAWAIAQTINATGAAPPNIFAIVPGKTKMLAPIVVLTMLAVSPGTPIARTNWSSAFCDFSGATALTVVAALSRDKPFEMRKEPVAKPALAGLGCEYARQLSR